MAFCKSQQRLNKVVIDGFVLSAIGLSAGPGSTLTLRRSLLRDLTNGAVFTSATVTIDRMQFSSNYASLTFDGGTLQLSNSVFAPTRSPRPVGPQPIGR